jgi:hypothetical protein
MNKLLTWRCKLNTNQENENINDTLSLSTAVSISCFINHYLADVPKKATHFMEWHI